MNFDKQKRLEANGWKVGSAEEFLRLTDEEKKIVDNNYLLSQVKVSRIAAHTLVHTIKYKDYYGLVEVDVEENMLYGRVIDIKDVITFKAETVEQVKIEFAKSVEDYLEFCKELN
jgi:hypothetical protein